MCLWDKIFWGNIAQYTHVLVIFGAYKYSKAYSEVIL